MESARVRDGAGSASMSYSIGDGLFRLGGAIALEDRVSWAPHLPGRFQPMNCYLTLEGEHGYLIDTSVPALRETVVSQLLDLVPPGTRLTVTMTRSEYECSGNIGAVHTSVPIDEILAGGLRNPFDAYDEVSRSVSKPTKRQRLASVTTAINPLGSSKRLSLIPSRFRILTTYWLYDSVTKTLFTSDGFGHTSIPAPDAPPAITSVADDDTTMESLRAHVLAKFSWLPMAQTAELSNWLVKLFEDFDVENIAPTHGCMLIGKPVVTRHLEMVLELLATVGPVRTSSDTDHRRTA